VVLIPIVPRAEFGWGLLIPLVIAGSGLGWLISQLNNYALSPISDERVSEAASANSAAGSFGLSFWIGLRGRHHARKDVYQLHREDRSKRRVLPPADQQHVAQALEENAQLMSNTQLAQLLGNQPPQIRDEIIRINTEARPVALQVLRWHCSFPSSPG
jgi:hypothetical protein